MFKVLRLYLEICFENLGLLSNLKIQNKGFELIHREIFKFLKFGSISKIKKSFIKIDLSTINWLETLQDLKVFQNLFIACTFINLAWMCNKIATD